MLAGLLLRIKSQPGVAYESAACKKEKTVTLFCKHEKKIFLISLFLCLPSISLGGYCQNNVVKGGRFEKHI